MARSPHGARETRIPDQEESESDDDDDDSESVGPTRSLKVSQNPVQPPVGHYYSCKKVAQKQVGDDGNSEIIGYDSAKLITTRVFCVRTGTIYQYRVLLVETFFVMFAFGLTSGLTVAFHRMHWLSLSSMWRQSQAIQEYCKVLTTITTFLMGFFTSTNYSRWWRLRTKGVGALWSAGANLIMLIGTWVTQDQNVISAIDRYTRASIMMIFMGQRGRKSELGLLVERDILTEDEVDKLGPIRNNNHQCCAIWTWVTCIIQGLEERGLIASEMVLRELLEQAQSGRASAQLVMNQLACPLPMSYVALLGLMVKVHNFSYAILYGLMATVTVCLHHRDAELPLGKTTFCIEICRVIILSTIFNALLLVNQGMMNPFDGTIPDTDFPMTRINSACKENLSEYTLLAQRLPKWMKKSGLNKGLQHQSLLGKKDHES